MSDCRFHTKKDREADFERRRMDLYIDSKKGKTYTFWPDGEIGVGHYSKEDWMSGPIFDRWRRRERLRIVSTKGIGGLP